MPSLYRPPRDRFPLGLVAVPSLTFAAVLGLLMLAVAGCPVLHAQEVKLPAEVKGAVGEFVVVEAATDDSLVKWRTIDPGLNVFPPHLLKDSKIAVVTAMVPGRYRLLAVSAKGDVPSDFAECLVLIGNPPPTPQPGPSPGPTPDPQPGPLPLPLSGMRVLILYETEPTTPLSRSQSIALSSPTVRAYLDQKCAKGPDGKTPERRWYDPHSSLSQLPAEWQSLRAAAKVASVPWVTIADSSGAVAFDGPYPATEAEALALFKKFGG